MAGFVTKSLTTIHRGNHPAVRAIRDGIYIDRISQSQLPALLGEIGFDEDWMGSHGDFCNMCCKNYVTRLFKRPHIKFQVSWSSNFHPSFNEAYVHFCSVRMLLDLFESLIVTSLRFLYFSAFF